MLDETLKCDMHTEGQTDVGTEIVIKTNLEFASSVLAANLLFIEQNYLSSGLNLKLFIVLLCK